MIYWTLFLEFAKIGLMAFGGGYATLPLIQQTTVYAYPWMTEQEFVDLVTISQMTPGPIFLNAATFVGCKVAGPAGGIVATLGAVTPSCILVSILAFLYLRHRNLSFVQHMLTFLRPVVVGLIAAAVAVILGMTLFHGDTPSLRSLDLLCLSIAALAFAVLRLRKGANPILVMLAGGVITLALHLLAWV